MLKKTKSKTNSSLYVHIPFCEHICSYCDFCKVLFNDELSHRYVLKLIDEINSYKIDKLKTIYVGGGTPSSLVYKDLELLLSTLSKLDRDDEIEFTMECNFENADYEKLLLMKKYGVNRLSFGVQTMNDNVLKNTLNRFHTRDDIFRIISIAKGIGFNNINVDLIYGLPGVDIKMLEEDLNQFLLLDIQHISTYSLMIEPHTAFFNQGIKEKDDYEIRMLYDFILDFLSAHGFQRYEVSNFAKKGFESKHNLNYWNNNEYYGVGLGAAGYINGVRYQNTRSLTKYLQGTTIESRETVDHKSFINYFLMLKLRRCEGFTLEELKEITEEKEYEMLLKVIDIQINKKLLVKKDDSIRCTDDGIMLLDMILRDIFE